MDEHLLHPSYGLADEECDHLFKVADEINVDVKRLYSNNQTRYKKFREETSEINSRLRYDQLVEIEHKLGLAKDKYGISTGGDSAALTPLSIPINNRPKLNLRTRSSSSTISLPSPKCTTPKPFSFYRGCDTYRRSYPNSPKSCTAAASEKKHIHQGNKTFITGFDSYYNDTGIEANNSPVRRSEPQSSNTPTPKAKSSPQMSLCYFKHNTRTLTEDPQYSTHNNKTHKIYLPPEWESIPDLPEYGFTCAPAPRPPRPLERRQTPETSLSPRDIELDFGEEGVSVPFVSYVE